MLIICELHSSSAFHCIDVRFDPDHAHDGRDTVEIEIRKYRTRDRAGRRRRISVLLERSRAIAENYCLATKDRIDVASSDKSDYATAAPEICLRASNRLQSPLIEPL